MIGSEIISSVGIYLPKVLTATVCGLIIGIEREYKNKPAGVRTMVLICSGCALLTAVSFKISPNSDPSRIIAQIITGIGFLGGGVIMKNDDKIMGVTTAAFIWVISALGIMIGIGETYVPIILTIGLVSLSLFLNSVEQTTRSVRNKIQKTKCKQEEFITDLTNNKN